MRQHGATDAARRPRLLIGPWSHGDTAALFPGQLWLRGQRRRDRPDGAQLRWFDHRLKGIDNGVDEDPPVRLFVMGIDGWRDEHDWPLPGTAFTRYYLHSDGQANTASATGRSTEAPADEPHDTFLYDPLDPVPTSGGATFLPGPSSPPTPARATSGRGKPGRRAVLHHRRRWSRHRGHRPDELVLYVSSSAPDTDFTGKLVDVQPDGRAELLTDGILRARYRESISQP